MEIAQDRRLEEAVRERVLAEQERDAARAELSRWDDVNRVSYRQSIRQYLRVVRAENDMQPAVRTSARLLRFKLRNLEFAASHGIGVPDVYRVWPDLTSMELNDLPDRFVLKADGGDSATAVLPLQRIGADSYQLVGQERVFTTAELRLRLAQRSARAQPPFFAEELLVGTDGRAIPNDLKCYMFYGHVGHVLVRRVGRHGVPSTNRLKFVDEHGQEFGRVAEGRRHSRILELPHAWSDTIEAARHLSRAVGLPFCRVDLYETTRGIVLGEITRAPSGGNERFVEHHDEMLGRRWVGAQARLEIDLASGRPAGALFGPHADLHLYPELEGAHPAGSATRAMVDCATWCGEHTSQ
ncbi:ATP-grasp fold amidoligase family protein [Ruania alba]|uniref:ATP-grasp fold amidoligase family protein n=1 Tax=Ruania alba TaxID=648782 RepID=UPI001587AD49|nr:ATP-grasp fold amidoligase family protein [Ruania alba]